VAAYTAAPRFPGPAHRLGAYQVVVEFAHGPARGVEAFAREVDRVLGQRNPAYAERRQGDVALGPVEVTALEPGAFQAWMRGRVKLDAYHKVPVCASDRRYVDDLLRAAKGAGAPDERPARTGPT
jgi:hypothetical protein